MLGNVRASPSLSNKQLGRKIGPTNGPKRASWQNTLEHTELQLFYGTRFSSNFFDGHQLQDPALASGSNEHNLVPHRANYVRHHSRWNNDGLDFS